MTIEMKATEQYFPFVLFIMLHKTQALTLSPLATFFCLAIGIKAARVACYK